MVTVCLEKEEGAVTAFNNQYIPPIAAQYAHRSSLLVHSANIASDKV